MKLKLKVTEAFPELAGGVQHACRAAPTSFMVLSDAALAGKGAASRAPTIAENLAVLLMAGPRHHRPLAWWHGTINQEDDNRISTGLEPAKLCRRDAGMGVAEKQKAKGRR
nr:MULTISPECIES: hypothetical protein [unclassified Mesorhizobium]